MRGMMYVDPGRKLSMVDEAGVESDEDVKSTIHMLVDHLGRDLGPRGKLEDPRVVLVGLNFGALCLRVLILELMGPVP